MIRATTDALLGGRYRLSERIAGGGMGEVWRALDEVLGRTVAVKLLREEYAEDPEFLTRFRAEARTTAALAHPGIAQVYDYGEAHGSAYLVMELVDGEPLSALLAREGALDATRTLDIVAQVAAALQAAHAAGVVHRDIKPGNLLVQPDGVVRVTDFGIARAVDAAPLTGTGMVLGTAYYLSPEQAAGGSATPASDLYVLGVVAYECLAGRRPFPGESPVGVALAHTREEPPPLPETVPAPLRSLVAGCLAKDPAARPASAAALAEQAAALADDAAWRPAELSSAGTTTAPLAAVPLVLPRGGPSLRGALVAVLTAALVLTGAVAFTSSLGDEPAGGGGQRARADGGSGPRMVTIRQRDYVGRPYAEVAAELRRLGLAVTRRSVRAEGTTGTVAAVTPTGDLPRGQRVTVAVVAAEADVTVTRSGGGGGADSDPGRPGKGKQTKPAKDDKPGKGQDKKPKDKGKKPKDKKSDKPGKGKKKGKGKKPGGAAGTGRGAGNG